MRRSFRLSRPKEWVQFSDKEDFLRSEHILYGYLADSEGDDEVVIYCQKEWRSSGFRENRNIRIGQEVGEIDDHMGKVIKSKIY